MELLTNLESAELMSIHIDDQQLKWWPTRGHNDSISCDPHLNNNVPCFCVSDLAVIMSGSQLFIFMVAIVVFLCYNCKNKDSGKRAELQSCVIVFALLLGFITRFVYVIYTFTGTQNCNYITGSTSYIAFSPQAIFFLVFIWLIFKLLVVWRVMLKGTDVEQKTERKRLKCITTSYCIVWLIVWFGQRTLEYLVIMRLQQSPDDDLPEALTYALFVVNFVELFMELALYGFFIQVLCVLRKFLTSFDTLTMPEYEQGLIKKSRSIFVVVSINIGILMFTNSMFSLISPFLWISDVFFSNPQLSTAFVWAVQLFYITNTIFSLVILYAMYHFASYDSKDDSILSD